MKRAWLSERSLGARVLSLMAGRIAVVIVLVTVGSYWHVYSSATANGLSTLAEYVRERGERESQWFVLAEDNLRVLMKHFFDERGRAPQRQVDQQFEQSFARNADGATRRRPGFNIHREPAAYIASRVVVDASVRRDIVTMTDLARDFGRAWNDRYLTTFMASMEGLAATYWPGVDWYRDLEPNAEFSHYPWVQNALPGNDPQRRPVWTGVWYDWVGKQYAATCILPVDVDGRMRYYAGTSISLEDIIRRTRDTGLQGTQNLIFRADGQLVSHPDEAIMLRLREQKGAFSIPTAGDAHLRAIYDAVAHAEPGHRVLTLDAFQEYLGVTTIEGPGWYFVSVLPKQQLSQAARSTAQTVLWLGLASLVLDLAIVGWILRRQVSQPLAQVVERLDAFGRGDWQARIAVDRADELGRLGQAFNHMAQALDEHQRQARDYATLLESEVAQRTRQLKEENRAKTRFLAAASHDLRQPIQAAALFVDHLKHAALPAGAQQAIRGLELSLQSVGGLLESLLDISKLDAGAVAPQVVDFPIRRVFDTLTVEFAAAAHAKGLRWHVHGAEAGWWVRSDPQLVTTVLRNLVANAVAYTPRGGIVLAARRRGDQLLVQVWDTGIGIAKDQLDRIYEEFYQVDNPQRDRSKGFGLGLAIVRRAADLLGAPVRCVSRLGRGTRFEWTLPLGTSPDVLSDAAPNTTPVHGQPPRQRVLLLEDDPLVGESLKAWLETQGCQVWWFRAVEPALAALSVCQADLYLSDCRLPGAIDGMGFLHEVQDRLGQPVRAVLITGDTSPHFIERAQRSGWQVLFKPVGPDHLAAVLAGWGEGAQVAARSSAQAAPASAGDVSAVMTQTGMSLK